MIDRRTCLAGALGLPLLTGARLPEEEPLAVAILSLPEAVPTTDGPLALYELTLSNMGTASILIERIVAFADGRRALDIEGQVLAARFDAPGPFYGPAMLPPGRIATVYLEVRLPDPLPRELNHEISCRHSARSTSVYRPAPAMLDQTPLPRLGPPLKGGPWVAIHSPDWPRGHRRVIYTRGLPRIPGRHAIDFVLADAKGRIAKGDADVPANALGYGAEVLAVADARVAMVRDGMKESASVSGNPAHAQDDAAGNFVSLDLGDGRFAIYEHLRPGSIRVKQGDRVRSGDAIAALGFTGDTTGPHLHFHVADAPQPLLGEGKGFVFKRFELIGSYPDLGDLGSKPWTGPASARTGEKPGPNTVVRF
ncbi:M23 family metallopeptidase [Sphingomonas sp. G-3-2-10]|uniref:peptidoglycan DD-metalloendopeptidase family protein n=1 Tax=Sphingomonas sp. G-3-2-10 TaxID=2728838 RepID=UPI00146DECC0|nr:M23 family metallopeptidase [Sphingomonas sp. G-3-2-10]